MDLKRNKRHEQIDKKVFNDKVKDRGDLKTVTKNDYRPKKDNHINNNRSYAGGDSRKVSNYQRPEKTKQVVSNKVPINENKTKPKLIAEVDKDQKPAYLKRVRDRYTTKLKRNQSPNANANLAKKEDPKVGIVKTEHVLPKDNVKSVSVSDYVKSYIEEVTQTKEKERSLFNNSDGAKDKKEQNTSRKKPIIKTIMTKHDTTRVYKAVTFGEQRQKPTPLQIKIPNDSMQKNVSKMTDVSSLKSKLTVSRISIHDKSEDVRKRKSRKHDRKYRHVPSRDGSYTGTTSPPTEVARWAPSSVDKHTKPYYEAWVNTTLAAISKNKNRDKLLNDEKFMLQSFRKAFERPETPELFYSNFADERYTGRIKITQR